MKARILIIDGDLRNCLDLKRLLGQHHFEVTIENDGTRGLHKMMTQDYDFCLIETHLHLKTSFQVVTEIRKVNHVIPIFFMSIDCQKENVIKGFLCGADDFIRKPFDPDILIIKIKNALRNMVRPDNGNFEFYFGDFYLNSKLRLLVHKNEEIIKLTPKENALLKLFLENLNEFLAKNTALQLIWKKEDFFTGKCMDVYIGKLRKYLAVDSSLTIENIRDSGYRLLSASAAHKHQKQG